MRSFIFTEKPVCFTFYSLCAESIYLWSCASQRDVKHLSTISNLKVELEDFTHPNQLGIAIIRPKYVSSITQQHRSSKKYCKWPNLQKKECTWSTWFGTCQVVQQTESIYHIVSLSVHVYIKPRLPQMTSDKSPWNDRIQRPGLVNLPCLQFAVMEYGQQTRYEQSGMNRIHLR